MMKLRGIVGWCGELMAFAIVAMLALVLAAVAGIVLLPVLLMALIFAVICHGPNHRRDASAGHVNAVDTSTAIKRNPKPTEGF